MDQTQETVVVLSRNLSSKCWARHNGNRSSWGVGTWGSDGWGEAATTPIVTNTLRIWSHDNLVKTPYKCS